MSIQYLISFIIIMMFATFLTRITPFLLPAKIIEYPIVQFANKILPVAILTLLVVFSLKDIQWTSFPFGAIELICVAVILIVHAWRRNALLSIFCGTALFMLLKQMSEHIQ